MIDCEFDTLILSLVLIWIFYVFNFNLQLSEIIAFLISISSKKVIPYIEKTLFTQSKIDDEIYTELKNNLSDEFAELRKKLLGEFK